MAGAPKGILVIASPNGWTDNSNALAWLEIPFGPGNSLKKRLPTPIVQGAIGDKEIGKPYYDRPCRSGTGYGYL